MAPSVVRDGVDVIDLTSETSSDRGDSDTSTVITVYGNWPMDDEDEDEAAQKTFTWLKGNLDDRNDNLGHFSRVPMSELPILFEISEQVLSKTPAAPTTTLPFLALPQELVFMIFILLNDENAACLASTCKQFGSATHSLAILNTRGYFIRHKDLEHGTDMCEVCHKSLVENWVWEWSMLPVTENDTLNDARDLSLMDSIIIDSDKCAFIKCPSCRAQDFYEMKMLDVELCQHEVESPMYGVLSDSDSETESSAIRADKGGEPSEDRYTHRRAKSTQ